MLCRVWCQRGVTLPFGYDLMVGRSDCVEVLCSSVLLCF